MYLSMKKTTLLSWFLLFTIHVHAQPITTDEIGLHEWLLVYFSVNGEYINLPTNPPGLQKVTLAMQNSNGLNSDWITTLDYGGNSLFFNIDFHEIEPTFILNYGAATLVESPWPSFELQYFNGIFLNNGNYEEVNPFSYNVIYLGPAPYLFISNNLGNTAMYGLNDMSIPKNSQNNMDVIVHGNTLEFTFLNEVEIEIAEIFNMQGQKANFLYQTGTTSYSIEHLPQGIYIVQVYGSDTTVFRKKIIKQ